MKISVVSAVYKAEKILPLLVEKLVSTLSQLNCEWEILLVDDRSPDNSWAMIRELSARISGVKALRLTRNFGQHYAISAGLDFAEGDYVVVIDCDLQDSIEDIPKLLKSSFLGNDIVFAKKKSRQFSFFRNLTTNIYYWIFNLLTEGKKVDNTIGTFSILSRKAILAYRRFRDVHRHYVLIVMLLGFKMDFVEVEHNARHSGRSTYTFRKLLNHALDGITSQSVRLLKYISVFGLFVLGFGMSLVIYFAVIYFFRGGLPSGYTSLAMLIILSMAVNIILTGVSSLYLGKVYEQVKRRPLYLIDEQINLNSEII